MELAWNSHMVFFYGKERFFFYVKAKGFFLHVKVKRWLWIHGGQSWHQCRQNFSPYVAFGVSLMWSYMDHSLVKTATTKCHFQMVIVELANFLPLWSIYSNTYYELMMMIGPLKASITRNITLDNTNLPILMI